MGMNFGKIAVFSDCVIGSTHEEEPNKLKPLQIGPRGSVVLGSGQRFAGPLTIEIRMSIVYIDGKQVGGRDAPVTINIDARDTPFAGPIELGSGKVTVHGSVHGSVRTMAGSIDVDGDVTGTASTMSGNVDVGGNVGGSATSMSGNVHVKGKADAMSGKVSRANTIHQHRSEPIVKRESQQ
jgi:hypothetical protein